MHLEQDNKDLKRLMKNLWTCLIQVCKKNYMVNHISEMQFKME